MQRRVPNSPRDSFLAQRLQGGSQTTCRGCLCHRQPGGAHRREVRPGPPSSCNRWSEPRLTPAPPTSRRPCANRPRPRPPPLQRDSPDFTAPGPGPPQGSPASETRPSTGGNSDGGNSHRSSARPGFGRRGMGAVGDAQSCSPPRPGVSASDPSGGGRCAYAWTLYSCEGRSPPLTKTPF